MPTLAAKIAVAAAAAVLAWAGIEAVRLRHLAAAAPLQDEAAADNSLSVLWVNLAGYDDGAFSTELYGSRGRWRVRSERGVAMTAG
ncbi:MAG TPA: hypothetical protein VF550_08920 [Polyangia bacterium]